MPHQLRVPIFLEEMGSIFIFGIPFIDSIDVEFVIPSLKVKAIPSQEFLETLFYE